MLRMSIVLMVMIGILIVFVMLVIVVIMVFVVGLWYCSDRLRRGWLSFVMLFLLVIVL